MVSLPTVSVWADQGAEWAKVSEVATYSELSFAPRHLDAGTWSLTMPYNSQALAFTRDRLVTFDWRGVRPLTGIVTTFAPSSKDGATMLEVGGVSATAMLSWALAWPDPTVGLSNQPYHDPNAPAPIVDDAETVVRTLILDNMVTRRGMTLAVPSNQHRGITLRARPAFDNLLDLVTKKARRGGLGVSLDLVDTSGTRADLTATIYEPQDLSMRVRFSETLGGSIREWTQTEQAPTATRTIVGGAGSAGSRIFRAVTTSDSDDAAVAWGGHREVFLDGPQSYDNTELDEAGTESLDQQASTVSLSVAAAEAAGLLAFTDYNVGDLATATLTTGLDVIDVISSIEVKITAAGPTVTPTFGDPDADDPALSTAQLLRALRREVRQIGAKQ